jgi:insertion element IS1 protein InsB
MIIQVLHCPYCQGTGMVWSEGKRCYRCQARQDKCGCTCFSATVCRQSLTVQEQIINMAMNASGIRYKARVLKISPTTVINELNKRLYTPTGESCSAATTQS